MQISNPESSISAEKFAARAFLGRLLVTLPVPLLTTVWAMVLRRTRGPFWLGTNFDPAYQYLLNSLSLSRGLPSAYADHPGATLQWLGAFMLHGINFFAGKDDLVLDVLKRPEFYLSAMHFILVVILFLSLLISGMLTMRWLNDPIAALLLQLGIFFTYTVRIRLSNMTPEPLLLILTVWLATTVVYHAYLVRRKSGKEPAWQYGLIAGLGMALKINFAPLVILPLVLLKGLIRRCVYLGVAAAVFIALALNPLMNYAKFTRFLTQLVTRQGYNRPIEPASSGLQAMLDGFFKLMQQFWHVEKAFVILILLFIAAGLLFFRGGRKNTGQAGEVFYKRLWLGLLLVLAAQIFLVANGPKAQIRYMYPFFGLSGLIAAVSWKWPQSCLAEDKKAQHRCKAFFMIMTVAILLLTALGLPGELGKIAKSTREWSESSRFKKENQLSNKPIIYHYAASDQEYALTFGSNWTRGHFIKELSSLYPNVYYYSLFKGYLFKDFGAQAISLFDLFRETDSVLVQGEKDRYVGLIDPKENNNLIVTEVIFEGTVEKITLVRPTPQLQLYLLNRAYQP